MDLVGFCIYKIMASAVQNVLLPFLLHCILFCFFAILFSLDPPIQFWKTVVKNGHLCLVLDIEKAVTPSQFKYSILARIFF